MTSRRPRLTPAIADVRRAVRESLALVQPLVRPSGSIVPARTGTIATNGHNRRADAPSGQGPTLPVTSDSPESVGAVTSEGPLPELVEGHTPGDPLILVGLSGGPDSLALAAATAFEAPRANLHAGAIIVDHGLQAGSADVAAQAAEQARQLGLDPVIVTRVAVGTTGGPEAAAREARYHAYADAIESTGASAVLLGHTLDDQAETVLLGLARGSGAGSLQGMAPSAPLTLTSTPTMPASTPTTPASTPTTSPATMAASLPLGSSTPGNPTQPNGAIRKMVPQDAPEEPESGSQGAAVVLRPLLGIRRSTTEAFCTDSGLEPWTDPHNSDPAYTRVRVRDRVLPVLEDELGPGIAVALARTAEQMREDESALDQFAEELIEDLAEHAEAGLALEVRGLAANPPALRQRIIRLAVSAEFGLAISRTQTLEIARLVTDWRGQGEVHLPGVRVERRGHLLVFSAAT